jgi:uncharacterized protein
MPRLKTLVAKESSLHGKGVFATVLLKQGEEIGTYEGSVVEENDTYVLWVTDEEGLVRGIEGENRLRYLNHSTTPNCEFDGDVLYALRDIEPDEELTFHYGDEFVEWLLENE